MINVFCPICKKLVPMNIKRNEVIKSKEFGIVEINEYSHEKHNWLDLNIDGLESDYSEYLNFKSQLKVSEKER